MQLQIEMQISVSNSIYQIS